MWNLSLICRGMLAVSMVALCSCATVADTGNRLVGENIAEDALRLNEAYSDATNAVILKNILRARDRWPTSYTTLSGIASKPAITTPSLTLSPLGVASGAPRIATSNATISPLAASEKSYNVTPFATKERSETLLTPFSASTFEEYFTSWPSDVIFLMFINDVEFDIIDTAKSRPAGKSIPTKTINIHNSGDDFTTFKNRLAAAFYTPDPILLTNPKFENNTQSIDLKALSISKPTKPINPPVKAACGEETFSISTLLSEKKMENLEKFQTLTKAKIKIKEATGGRVSLSVCENKSSGKVLMSPSAIRDVRFSLRSFDDMVYYIGETLRTVRNSPQSPTVKSSCKTDGPIFNVVDEFEQGDYAVEVTHNKATYKAVPADNVPGYSSRCKNERSSTVMSLLNHLLLLNQSAKFLETPQIIDR